MSIEDRLRTGLAANTDHLQPSLDVELARLLRRRQRRRQARAGGGVLVAAAIAGAVWLSGVATVDRSEGPGPSEEHVEVGEPTDMSGIYGPLEPGTYSMPLWREAEDGTLPRAQVEVPEGYFSNGGYVVDAGNSATEPDQWGEVAVWRVEHIVPDPCDGSTYADIGPSVRALARALTRQPGQETTRPRPVTLDGYPGLYLEVTSTLPEIGGCAYGMHALWHTGDAGDEPYGQDRPGVTNHLWILDVDGTRLVVAVSNHPYQSDAQHQGLLDIAKTIHFIDPAGP
jgi:hypothetical protein